MTGRRTLEQQASLEKNERLAAGDRRRFRITGDRTIINTNALNRHYKLVDAYAGVRNLEYRGKEALSIQPFSRYRTWVAESVPARFSVERKRRPRYTVDERYMNRKSTRLYPNGDMLILVDSAVYDSIAESLRGYVLDAGRDGYWASIHVATGGTPNDIRSYIRSRRPTPSGVLLVGSIAAPWYEIAQDFHGRAEFPCDLYYMDTNGTWTDADGNGILDGHTDNVSPELWVGRIYTPTQNGNDAELINDYFQRNAIFRRGGLGHARSALAYVDDDWQAFGDCALDLQFPASAITVYTAPGITDADLFKAEVQQLRSWVQVCAHSSTTSSAFRVGATNEHIDSAYLRDINPPNAHFHNLFCCGPGRYTSADYLAGWYIFDRAGGQQSHGMTAIASSKSGSMLMFEDFYRPLGEAKCIGDAMVEWWQARGPVHEPGERSWYYGLNVIGDPTLTWWKGAVPRPTQPQDGDTFDHWPRLTQFRWDPVNIAGVKYDVEVDYDTGAWALETGRATYVYQDINDTMLDHTFVGAQRGRWRVRATIDGTLCSWSPWSYFRYTV